MLWGSAELLAVASRCHGQDWTRRVGRNFKIECSHPLATAKRFCPVLHFQLECAISHFISHFISEPVTFRLQDSPFTIDYARTSSAHCRQDCYLGIIWQRC